MAKPIDLSLEIKVVPYREILYKKMIYLTIKDGVKYADSYPVKIMGTLAERLGTTNGYIYNIPTELLRGTMEPENPEFVEVTTGGYTTKFEGNFTKSILRPYFRGYDSHVFIDDIGEFVSGRFFQYGNEEIGRPISAVYAVHWIFCGLIFDTNDKASKEESIKIFKDAIAIDSNNIII